VPCDALTRFVAGRAAQSYRPLSKDAIQQHLEDFGMEAEITNHNAILGLSGAPPAPAAAHARTRSRAACAPGQGRARTRARARVRPVTYAAVRHAAGVAQRGRRSGRRSWVSQRTAEHAKRARAAGAVHRIQALRSLWPEEDATCPAVRGPQRAQRRWRRRRRRAAWPARVLQAPASSRAEL